MGLLFRESSPWLCLLGESLHQLPPRPAPREIHGELPPHPAHRSKRTFQRIRLNYGWALGYNLCAVPIAAGALYPPLHFQVRSAFGEWVCACRAASCVFIAVQSAHPSAHLVACPCCRQRI